MKLFKVIWQRARGKRQGEQLMGGEGDKTEGANDQGAKELGAKDRKRKIPGPALYNFSCIYNSL